MKKSREHINFLLMLLNTEYCKNVKKIVLWSDNCFTQNKNWSLFANLVKIINDPNIFQETITLKFLERGHTFNICDSLHSNISRKFASEHEVYSPDHCLKLIQKSREKNYAKQVMFNDIILFDDESKAPPKPFKINDLKQYEVRKGKFTSFFKLSHSDTNF
jgi:hypothetical protein